MRNKRITLYTKVCAKCMWPEKMVELQSYAQSKELRLKVKRTAYRPYWHREACKLWGSEDYMAFVEIGGKVEDFNSWASKAKAKPVKKGKKKDGVRRLPEAEGGDREGRLANQEGEVKEEDEMK